jgi:hypothetical protein
MRVMMIALRVLRSLAVILWELVNRCIKSKYEAPFSEYKNLTMDFQIIIQGTTS